MVRFLLVLGWAWPFVVAVGGVMAIEAGHPLRSDGALTLLLCAALLGAPAVIATFVRRLPAGWPDEARVAAALTLAAPVVAAELLAAFCLLISGANAAGPGLIE